MSGQYQIPSNIGDSKMASFKNPPEMRDGLTYDDWKKEMKIWCSFTEIEKKRQGPAVFLTLKGKARETVLAEVEAEKLQTDDGLSNIIKALDNLYKRSDSESAFTAFENFIKFRRPSSMSIQDYIIEFNIKLGKIKSHDMELPDGVLAYYLLDCANLPEEQVSLCRATCDKLTYSNMKSQIERVVIPSSSQPSGASSAVPIEPQFVTLGQQHKEEYPYLEPQPCADQEYYDREDNSFVSDSYYGQGGFSQGYRSRGYGPTQNVRPGRQINPPDEFGNPTPCRFCKSIYHWIGRCPDAPPSVKSQVSRSKRGGFMHPGRPGNRGFNARNGGRGTDRNQFQF